MSRTGGARGSGPSKPKSQGGSTSAPTQTPIRGGSNADRPPTPAKMLNRSIKAPGAGTGGDGKTVRRPRGK